MIIRARAPLRISFAGGGTDVPPYCDERGGAVLNATINRHAYATLVPGGEQFRVRSLDYDASICYGIHDTFVFDGQLDLAKGVIDYFRTCFGFSQGFELFLHNDAPPGSGLGSSSAITVAMVSAFAELLRLPFNSYRLADLAYTIERHKVGIQGGKQDHYAAAFGGFNFIEFAEGISVVNALRVPAEFIYELEYSLVFAYVGGSHFSAHIIEKQVDNYQRGDQDAVTAMDSLKVLATDMKQALLLQRLQEFGVLLDQAWESKKRMADGITTPEIDQLYQSVRGAGALGGKISGAGGGGFMFFLCRPQRRFAVQDALRRSKAQIVNLSFTDEGVRTWTTA